MSKDLTIRPATKEDFEALYALGRATPEIQASAQNEFMGPDEFLTAIQNPQGVFLVAKLDQKSVGFIYFDCESWKGGATRWASLVYVAVAPEHRHAGVAQALYDRGLAELIKRGVQKLYSWAYAEGDQGIIKFFKKQGLVEGHKYVWMDKDLRPDAG
jgi:predicted N-acetyltransferase YhbS